MEHPKLIPFESKDIKKLKGKKLFQFIFFIYLTLVSVGVIALAIWTYYFEDEKVLGQLTGFGALCGVFATVLIYRSWINLKRDFSNGVKEVIQGEISKKYTHKNRHEFTINGVDYVVKYKHYIEFKKGETVLISYAPLSKIILDIHKLPKLNLYKG